ncbi:uncharacterized protein LOC143295078 [Babylonia areolata]|uniref:uncharacterized protein LOC143295078 n=1 Tax=Babylonia areolata TaxID=304850 RepID=UPI003FD2BF03
MEVLQTTESDETTFVFSESETGEEVKDSKKKDRKELFQINTHPSTVVAANNKRDQRLKQIVMRVVAFCKKEHEEGQQVPFRFFKKRASLMTGVSLSTIHRIETIDMKAPPSPPHDPQTSSSLSSSSSPSKAKPRKDATAGQKKKAKKKKKRRKEEGEEGGGCCAEAVHVSATPASLLQHGVVAGSGEHTTGHHQHIHFQVPTAAGAIVAAATAKPAKKKKQQQKKKMTTTKIEVAAVVGDPSSSHNHININSTTTTTTTTSSTPTATATILTSDLTLPATVQAVVQGVSGVVGGEGGGGVVTAINVHSSAMGGNPTHPQQRAPCTWTAGPIGPFAVGDLRDGGHQVQLSAAPHIQVHAQHVQAIPVSAQLQPITVAAAVATQQGLGFGSGQLEGGHGQVNWTTAPVGPAFGAATLVGQQVVHASYPSHLHPGPPGPGPGGGHAALTPAAPQQQQPQHSPVFYQF